MQASQWELSQKPLTDYGVVNPKEPNNVNLLTELYIN